MKKFFILFASLFLGIFIAEAQQPQMPNIPIDPSVRIGKLSNGLTYYIRKNTKKPHLADFYIAQKVGSILEEPQQRGLAHFLEHMAFNGTKNFPSDKTGLGIVPWCETAGIKFGYNLNAYTSIDKTVYNISDAPLTRAGVLDSCLLILHDWSHSLLLSDKEIDKERGVIHEEWRTRRTANQRLYEEALPLIFKGDKYADCMPIGSMDIVDHFPYKDLRDYYKKWYRPDLQGIIIVGDIDVDQVEAKIKQIFGSIPAAVSPAQRIYYPVSNNKEPIIVVAKDKEQTHVVASIDYKQDAYPDSLKNKLSYLMMGYFTNMATNMINDRLEELTQKANPPFLQAGAGYDDFIVTKAKECMEGYVVCKEDSIEKSISSLIDELQRVRQHGFTASEYARARANYLKGLETQYNNRKDVENRTYVNQYVNNFLDNEPIPSIEYTYQLMNQIAPNITVETINQQLKSLMPDSNQVLILFGPEKESIKYPTKEALTTLLTTEESKQMAPYIDKVSNEPLIKQEPKPGKVVSKKVNQKFGTTLLTLSNGVKVWIKKTDFKADEIRMDAFSFGGNSLFEDKDFINYKFINDVVEVGGLGNFSATDLPKQLAGKNVSVSPFVNTLTQGLSGSCSPKDFATMIQLTYLYFKSPRMDQAAFESFKSRTKASLENRDSNPIATYIDSLSLVLYGNKPRVQPIKAKDIDRLDYQRTMELYKDRFKNAGEFNFVLVGNVNIDSVTPYLEKYLGSLPNINQKETFKDNNMYIRPVNETHVFYKKQETPSALVTVIYSGTTPYTETNYQKLDVLEQALTMIYTEKVREDEGGSYGVNVSIVQTKYPKPLVDLTIQFRTGPEKYNKMIKIIYDQLAIMEKEGPKVEDLKKIKEYMLKQYDSYQKENSYWMGLIHEYLFTGLDKNNGYKAIVNKITVKDIQQCAAELLKQKHRVEITMTTDKK